MRDIDPNKCIDFILENAGKYAQAKGELAQLEAFKNSLKAIKMYDDALKSANPTQMLEISVDIAESAEKLEQLSCDYINGV
jgi:hypothetical protein